MPIPLTASLPLPSAVRRPSPSRNHHRRPPSPPHVSRPFRIRDRGHMWDLRRACTTSSFRLPSLSSSSSPSNPPTPLHPYKKAMEDHPPIPRAAPAEVMVAVYSYSSASSSPDEDGVDACDAGRPLLRRAPSACVPAGCYQKRRRRVASDSSLHSLARANGGVGPLGGGGGITRRPSLREDVEHAAAETYLITRLSFTLLRYLGVGYRWITKFLALTFYAILLMPGFLQVGYNYFFSSQVRRSIVYGEQPRNRLDLYLPANIDEPKPVVAFVTGGAWIIGYKAWGSLLGKQLAERGIIVACIDYRNFPQGTISDMIKDASLGVSFVCNNIAEYGGDPNRIYLMGQSAGAQIATCVLIEQAIKECGEGERTSWSVSQIKAYFSISGGYNLLNLVDHFHRRGLYRSIFLSIMEGEQSLAKFSPEVMVQHPGIRHAISLLPRIILYHGTGDYSIPCDASKTFADTLQKVGGQVELILYEGKTHTDLFLQDPLRGGKDELLQDILSVIHAGDAVALAEDANAPPHRRLVPEFMLQLARKVSPF